jgi:polynucleotide 5'-kinase involved in rRNA processing
LINKNICNEDIFDFLNVKIGTARGNAIIDRVNSLKTPPKPFPKNCKQVQSKSKNAILPLFLYQGKYDRLRKYYTFLVIGQTGTGKTTLLDAFVNKLTGMNYIDNWRWKLVDESYI